MHVKKARTIAVLGIMAAFGTVLLLLGTVIAVNTLFFTAAAAFLAGLAVVFYGVGCGAVYVCVCGLLDFLFNPDKLHVLLYLAMAGYLVLAEGSYRGMKKMADGRKKEWVHRGLRLLFFGALYVPVLLFMSGLFLPERIRTAEWYLPVLLPAGFFVWLIYDAAYSAVKKLVHDKFGRLPE